MAYNVNERVGKQDNVRQDDLDAIDISLYGKPSVVDYGHGTARSEKLDIVDFNETQPRADRFGSRVKSPLLSISSNSSLAYESSQISSAFMHRSNTLSNLPKDAASELSALVKTFKALKSPLTSNFEKFSTTASHPQIFSKDDFVPPFDSMMCLKSTRLQRDRFLQEIEIGDVVCCSVLAVKDTGLDLVLLCFAYKRNREIDHLKIMAHCSSRDIHEILYGHTREVSDIFSVKDKVSGVVIGISLHNEKIQISLLKRDLPARLEGELELGLMRSEDLPSSYKTMCMSEDLSYSQILTSSLTFQSPGLTQRVCKQLGISEDIGMSSLFHRVISEAIPPEETAIALRKKQSKLHALQSVIEGVKLYKSGGHNEALIMYNKALDIDVDNVEALVARGALYANNESYHRALGDFRHALKVNSQHQNAKDYLMQTLLAYARDLEDTDKKSSAQECYEEILMYDSSHSIAKEKLEALNTTEANQESLVTSTRPDVSRSESPSYKAHHSQSREKSWDDKRRYSRASSVSSRSSHKSVNRKRRRESSSSDSSTSLDSSRRGGSKGEQSSKSHRRKYSTDSSSQSDSDLRRGSSQKKPVISSTSASSSYTRIPKKARNSSSSKSPKRRKKDVGSVYVDHHEGEERIGSENVSDKNAQEDRDVYGLAKRDNSQIDIFSSLTGDSPKMQVKKKSSTIFLPYCLSTDPAILKKPNKKTGSSGFLSQHIRNSPEKQSRVICKSEQPSRSPSSSVEKSPRCRTVLKPSRSRSLSSNSFTSRSRGSLSSHSKHSRGRKLRDSRSRSRYSRSRSRDSRSKSKYSRSRSSRFRSRSSSANSDSSLSKLRPSKSQNSSSKLDDYSSKSETTGNISNKSSSKSSSKRKRSSKKRKKHAKSKNKSKPKISFSILKTTPAKVDGAKNAQNKQIDPTISTETKKVFQTSLSIAVSHIKKGTKDEEKKELQNVKKKLEQKHEKKNALANTSERDLNKQLTKNTAKKRIEQDQKLKEMENFLVELKKKKGQNTK